MVKFKDKKKGIKILGLLILIFLALRLILIFNTGGNINPLMEQCYTETISKNIINGEFSKIIFLSVLKNYPFSILGINFTLTAYRQIILGFFDVPFFLLFGISGFTLKLSGLMISLFALILIFYFIEKFFDLKVAVVTALLFIFAPYSHITHSIIASTYNFDIFILNILIIFYLFRLVFKKNNYLSTVMIFGFLCGFAFLYNMINIIIIINCILFLIIFKKNFFISKYFIIFILFFTLGISPHIVFNYKFAMGHINPPPGVEMANLSNIKEVLLYDIPASFNFGDLGLIRGEILNYIYYLIFIFAYLFVSWSNKDLVKSNLNIKVRNQKKKECFFLIYPLLFIFFSLFNLLNVEYPINPYSHRHILSLYMFIFVIVALFIVKLWSYNKKIISVTLIAIIILLSIKGGLNLIALTGDNPIHPVICDKLVASAFPLFPMIFTNNISFIAEGCDEFKKELRQDCYAGLGQRVYQKYKGDLNLSFKECTNFKNNFSNACIYGLAIATGYDYPSSLDKSIEKCSYFESEYREKCYFILGNSIATYYQKNESFVLRECKKIKTKNKYDCIRGALTNN